MLGLLRALLPKNERFVDQLCRHSRHVADGAVAFRALMSDEAVEAHYAELCRLEEAADEVTRETIQSIHRSFVTPFDRSQILELITALDDTIDLMKETGQRIRLYAIAFTPEMRAMGDCIVRATTEIRDTMPCLSAIARNVQRLNAMQMNVRLAEGEADDLLERGLARLFSGPERCAGPAIASSVRFPARP
jgi:predicted phosphate transport protein (TIGR00153 family)